MAKPPEPIWLIFDTSILTGLCPSRLSAEFKLVRRLAEFGKLKLWVPEVAANEWLSQRVDHPLKVLDDLQATVKDMQRHPCLAEQSEVEDIVESKLFSEKRIKRLREQVYHWNKEQFHQLGLNIVEL
jgi:hypothetical protein